MDNDQRNNLLTAAKILRELEHPWVFDMSIFGTNCGTPCCVLGHYASRRDLQDAFLLDDKGYLWVTVPGTGGELKYRIWFSDAYEIRCHFGLDVDGCLELFSAHGCGLAEEPHLAAAYIEEFVRTH
jgi:hypothetical protein